MSLKSQIDKAMARNRDLRGRITVPEWGDDEGNPAVVYYHQPTAAEARKINRLAEGDAFQSLVYTLIYALEDSDGNKLFTVEDKKALLDQPSNLIVRLAECVGERPTLEQQIKN